MITSELERLVRERKAKGHIPFFVNATAGSTVLGAFDPIPEIADICEKYGMWLHVDVSLRFLFVVTRGEMTQVYRKRDSENPHKK